MPPRNILFIVVTRIGDTLLVTPTLHALKQKWPAAKIHVVAHPRQIVLLQNNPDITSLSGFTKKSAHLRGRFQTLGGLRKTMDLALVYGADQNLFAYARRMASKVIGFESGIKTIDGLMDHTVAPTARPMRAVEDRALLLGPLNIKLPQRRLQYFASDKERQWANTWLRQKTGIPADTPLVGLQANSFASKAYRNLPPSMVKDVIAGLPAQFRHAQLILLGGPNDQANNQAIAKIFDNNTLDISGQFSLRESAAIISQLDLFIGIDTGPTHIAGCFNIPMVALYHCKHPGKYLMPLDHPCCAIVEHPRPLQDCPEKASIADICMADIHAAIAQVTESTSQTMEVAS